MRALRWSRRRFLGATGLAGVGVCVGCTGSGQPTVVSSHSATTEPATPSSNGTPPSGLPGPGGRVHVGTVDDVVAEAGRSPVYVPEARAWLVRVPDDDVAAMVAASDERLLPGLDARLLALHQKCPHLGCRVPFCESSGWFECACHGAVFTSLGEERGGPSPRGLDAFPIDIADDRVSIDTSVIVDGRPSGTVLVEQPVRGPHCVDVAADH